MPHLPRTLELRSNSIVHFPTVSWIKILLMESQISRFESAITGRADYEKNWRVSRSSMPLLRTFLYLNATFSIGSGAFFGLIWPTPTRSSQRSDICWIAFSFYGALLTRASYLRNLLST